MAQNTQWWNPFDGDVIPGINVGNGWKQLTTGKDYDVIEGVSTGNKSRPGQMHVSAIPDVGVRVSAANPTGQEQSGGGSGGGGGTTKIADTFTPAPIAVDPYAALMAANAAKAGGFRDRILGKAGDIDSIYEDIIGAIDTALKDKKEGRQRVYDTDSANLLNALTAAIPEIQKAFASLGLTTSTYVGDRVGGTRDEYEKSQEGVDTQYENDLTDYGNWAKGEKTNAGTARSKLSNKIDYVKDLDPTADNLQGLQQAASTFDDALADFGGQKNMYGNKGEAMKTLNSIGTDYDFGKVLDAFGSFAGSAANTGEGGGAAQKVADNIRGLSDKAKKKLTEVQVNNPVGAATA